MASPLPKARLAAVDIRFTERPVDRFGAIVLKKSVLAVRWVR